MIYRTRMPAFDRKYSDEQRDAVAFAYLHRNLTAQNVHELAKAGDLKGERGQQLEPFTMPIGTIRSLARRDLDKRRGRIESPLAELPPRDAIETLRRRYINVADAMLRDEEDKRPSVIDPERMRQIGVVIREASRIPGPTEPRPASPGARDAEGKQGPRARGGLAGALVADHRRSNGGGETAHDTTHSDHVDGDRDGTERSDGPDVPSSSTEHSSPGSFTSEQVAALG